MPTTTDPKPVDEPIAASKLSAAGARALPRSDTVGAPPGVALTVRVAVLFDPAVVGRKATDTAQLAWAARVGMQPLAEMVNSAAFGPLSAAASAVVVPAATSPLLVTVKLCAALVVPTTVSV
jgi:hypothetical protein